jgi:hypothetical protein
MATASGPSCPRSGVARGCALPANPRRSTRIFHSGHRLQGLAPRESPCHNRMKSSPPGVPIPSWVFLFPLGFSPSLRWSPLPEPSSPILGPGCARRLAPAWISESSSAGRLACSSEPPTLLGFFRHDHFIPLGERAGSGLLILRGPQVASLLLVRPF